MHPFFFRELQRIILLLLIDNLYMSWGTRFFSPKLCVGFFRYFRFLIIFIKIYIFVQEKSMDSFVGNMAKGRISKRVFQENKARQIFQKTNHSYPLIYLRVRIRGKKCSFFGRFGVLSFIETPVLRFALLPYYRRLMVRRERTIFFTEYLYNNLLYKKICFWELYGRDRFTNFEKKMKKFIFAKAARYGPSCNFAWCVKLV